MPLISVGFVFRRTEQSFLVEWAVRCVSCDGLGGRERPREAEREATLQQVARLCRTGHISEGREGEGRENKGSKEEFERAP